MLKLGHSWLSGQSMLSKIRRSCLKDDKLVIVSKDKKSGDLSTFCFIISNSVNTYKKWFDYKIFYAFWCVTLYLETLLDSNWKGVVILSGKYDYIRRITLVIRAETHWGLQAEIPLPMINFNQKFSTSVSKIPHKNCLKPQSRFPEC